MTLISRPRTRFQGGEKTPADLNWEGIFLLTSIWWLSEGWEDDSSSHLFTEIHYINVMLPTKHSEKSVKKKVGKMGWSLQVCC